MMFFRVCLYGIFFVVFSYIGVSKGVRWKFMLIFSVCLVNSVW